MMIKEYVVEIALLAGLMFYVAMFIFIKKNRLVKPKQENDHSYEFKETDYERTMQPYFIQVTNTTNFDKRAVLFGENKHLLSINHGSEEGVVIQAGQPNVTYTQMLRQSADDGFETNLIQIRCHQVDLLYYLSLNVVYSDANGQSAFIPYPLKDYLEKDETGGVKFKNWIDIPINIKVDGKVNFEITLPPKVACDFLFFQPNDKLKRKKHDNI